MYLRCQRKDVHPIQKSYKSLFESNFVDTPRSKSEQIEKMLQRLAVLQLILHIGIKGEDI